MTLKNSIKQTAIALAAFGGLITAMAATEASAGGYYVNQWAQTVDFPEWDRLNIRKWPASHSQKIAHIKRGKWVKVERCIIKSGTDWCLIRKGWKEGWVNGRFIERGSHTFADVHPAAFGWH